MAEQTRHFTLGPRKRTPSIQNHGEDNEKPLDYFQEKLMQIICKQEKESVANHDGLRPEMKWYFKIG